MGLCSSSDTGAVESKDRIWTPPKKQVCDYKLGTQLGNGASCQVFVAKRRDGKKFALKQLDKHTKDGGEDIQDLFLAEARLLRKLEHPNILEFVDAYELPDYYHLITPYYRGGELFNKVVEGKFSERVASVTARDMLRAVAHCHSKSIVHRDLKPENFVFESKSANSRMKLIDFGCALEVGDDEEVKDVAGSPYYVAPEVLKSGIKRTGGIWKAADMWSMGVIIFLLVSGYPPFNGESQQQIFARIKRARFRFKNFLSDGVKDLITKLLQKDPSKRLTAEQALQHPWIADTANVSDQALPASVQSSLKEFVQGCKLKKAIGKILAGRMTDAHKDQVAEVFQKFDKDGNGVLDRNEVMEMMKYIGHTTDHDAEIRANALMDAYDDDNNDGLDFEEFKAFHASQKIKTNVATEMFHKADADNSGYVDHEELATMLKDEVVGITDDEIQTMIQEVDNNNDGQIDLGEWLNALTGYGKKKRRRRKKRS